MAGRPYPIMSCVPPTKVLGRGRPKGIGCNLSMLNKLKEGNVQSCIWNLDLKKMRSIKTTAGQHGIKIKVRRLHNGLYALWRMETIL